MTEEEEDDYYENPPDCGNCKHWDKCSLRSDDEFEDDCCEEWEQE